MLNTTEAAIDFDTRRATSRLIKTIVEAATLTIENTPVLGGGANVYGYSDVKAYTVISISKSGRTAILQRDKTTLLNGHDSDAADKLTFEPGGFCGHTSGRQRYSYEQDPEGVTVRVSLRSGGKFANTWRTKGQATDASRVCFGERCAHYDFNF